MTAAAWIPADPAALGCRICSAPVVGAELLFCAGHRAALPRRLVLDLELHAGSLPEPSPAFCRAVDRAVGVLERLERAERERELQRDQMALNFGTALSGLSDRPRPSTRSRRRRPGVHPATQEVTAWPA